MVHEVEDTLTRRARLRLLPAALLAAIAAACSEGGARPGLLSGDIDPETVPTMTTRAVETLVSDSGVTRYHITAPLWLVFEESKVPCWKFPEGIALEKYDPLFRPEATVTAREAYYDKNRQLWRLDGDVTVTNTAGERFLTPQLYWDQRQHRVYSDSFIHIERSDRTLEGYGFTSNENVTAYTIRQVQGIFPASEFTSRRDSV